MASPINHSKQATCVEKTYFIINFFVLLKGHLHLDSYQQASCIGCNQNIVNHINGLFFSLSRVGISVHL